MAIFAIRSARAISIIISVIIEIDAHVLAPAISAVAIIAAALSFAILIMRTTIRACTRATSELVPRRKEARLANESVA